MLMYYIVLSLVWASVLLWSLLLFFLVGDPFILAHAIGALLYLCIHRSVQHKKSIESFLCDLSKKKKVVFVRKRKRSRHCEARTHDIHVIARRCTTRKLPPPPYTTGDQKLTNKLLTAHKRTSWEHDYVGLAQAPPVTEFTPGLRFYPISAEARRAWCTVQSDGP